LSVDRKQYRVTSYEIGRDSTLSSSQKDVKVDAQKENEGGDSEEVVELQEFAKDKTYRPTKNKNKKLMKM